MVTWLERGDLRLGLVPELGGRLLSVRHRGVELLWRNADFLDDDLRGAYATNAGRMGDWVNYGGDKTWPAPQGWDGPDQWVGPPDPVLDSGPYSVTADGDTVTMTSAPDPRTGLRLTRAVTLLDDGYRLDLRAENVSARWVRWALWNVTQLPGGGSVIAGLRRPDVVALVAGTGTPEYTVDDDRLVVPADPLVRRRPGRGVPGRELAAGDLAGAPAAVTAGVARRPRPARANRRTGGPRPPDDARPGHRNGPHDPSDPHLSGPQTPQCGVGCVQRTQGQL
jgi:hypothetical protein